MREKRHRFMLRHPLRWAAHWWPHLVVALLLFAIAFAWMDSIYDPVRAVGGWPIAVAVVAALVIASAVKPRSTRLVAATSTAMIVLGVVRAAAYLELAVVTDVAPALLIALASKWLLFSMLGYHWTRITREAALSAAVESGRCDLDELGGEDA